MSLLIAKIIIKSGCAIIINIILTIIHIIERRIVLIIAKLILVVIIVLQIVKHRTACRLWLILLSEIEYCIWWCFLAEIAENVLIGTAVARLGSVVLTKLIILTTTTNHKIWLWLTIWRWRIRTEIIGLTRLKISKFEIARRLWRIAVLVIVQIIEHLF